MRCILSPNHSHSPPPSPHLFHLSNARYGSDVIARSQVSRGDPARTALLLAKLLSGRHVSITAIGGSVTAALYLPTSLEVGKGSYPYHVASWLNTAFPTSPSQPPHSFTRAFLPGAGSFALRFCAFELFRQLWGGNSAAEEGKKADLVIVECAVNDFVMTQPGMTPVPGEKYSTCGGCIIRGKELFLHIE